MLPQGTYNPFKNQGIECVKINKVKDGHPHIVDMIKENMKVRPHFSIEKESRNHNNHRFWCKSIL